MEPGTQSQGILPQMQSRTGYKLNLADGAQYQYVLSTLIRAGDNPQKSPALFHSLEMSRSNTPPGPPVLAEGFADGSIGTVVPLNLIQSLHTNSAAGTATTTVVSSIPGGTTSTTIVVNYRTLSDPNPFYTSPLYKTFTEGEDYQITDVAPLGPAQQGQTIVATAQILATTHQGTTSYVWSDDDSSTDAVDHCVTAPNYVTQQGPSTPCPPVGSPCINKGTVTTPIKGCYGRSGSDCNYVWGGQGYPSTIPVAIAGKITFPHPIATPLNGQLLLDLQLGNGGCFLYPASGAGPSALPANFTIDPDNNAVLNYCFQSSQFLNNGCLTQVSNLTNLDMTVYVNLQVPGGGSNIGMGTVSSNSGNNPNQPWFALIPQYNVFQGCFAAGTQILMADGSLKAVEQFKADGSEEVITNEQGTRRKVVGNTTGVEEQPMFQITDDRGNTVLLTERHPLVTVAGVKQARQVIPGDGLFTRQGPSRVVRVEQVRYPGSVWNIAVGQAADAPKAETTVYANNIRVGDLFMQQHFAARTRETGLSREEVLRLLPPEWQQDFLNYIPRK